MPRQRCCCYRRCKLWSGISNRYLEQGLTLPSQNVTLEEDTEDMIIDYETNMVVIFSFIVVFASSTHQAT